MYDAGNNGICCEDGDGYFYVQSGSDFLFDGGDFADYTKVSFETADFLSAQDSPFIAVKVFPNPALSSFNISNALGYDIKVIDILGKEVIHNMRITTINERVNISQLNEGTYYVQVSNRFFSRNLKLIVLK
jgi:hypothetical protein